MHALIADDSRVARRLVDRIVRDLGFETTHAEHGLDALEKMRGNDVFDVALVDWNMPVMDGIDFVREMRREPRFASTSVVMVTSESDPANIARALMVGADEYLIKPFDAEMLRDKLEIIGLLAVDG